MFEEVIDTSKLKITVSKHMFLQKQQLKTTKWQAELLLTCRWYANFFGSFGGTQSRKGWEPLF